MTCNGLSRHVEEPDREDLIGGQEFKSREDKNLALLEKSGPSGGIRLHAVGVKDGAESPTRR